MRAVSGVSGVPRGRWVWGVSGVVTALLLTVPAARFLVHGGSGPQAVPRSSATFTVTQPVKAVDISSDGTPVQVIGGAVSRVTVTEPAASVSPGGPSPFTEPLPPVTDGRLTLAPVDGPGPVTLTVPRDTAVTVTANGGPVLVAGLAGSLTADSDGGPVRATGLTSRNVTVTTGGGSAALSFGAAPSTVSVLTDGGPARLGLPGGPYALNASTGGDPEQVGVATDPAAKDTLTVSTGGGPLVIGPPSSAPAS